jgi:sterol desaturase/sphingolipid hydroxylase (fatty acid hydroxylase superfamily)
MHLTAIARTLFDTLQAHLTGAHLVTLGLLWFTVLLAAVFTFRRSEGCHMAPREFLRHLLPAGTLSHPSARADFLFWISRRVFMPLIVLPTAISVVGAGHVAHQLLTDIFGTDSSAYEPASPGMLVLFTLSMLVAYDLSYYLYHLLQHKIPMLWELHKVHHSAEVMVGVTRERVHPLDEIMNRWWDGLIPGLMYGVWLFFLHDPVEVTVFGLNVYFLRNTIFMMDFVRHTHLRLSYGRWLNELFLCPHYHQLHHSLARAHWDKNFGLMFSFWDRLFGTLSIPEQDEVFAFGLPNREHDEYQSLYALHVVPLTKMWRMLRPSRRPSPQSNPSRSDAHTQETT